MTKEEAIDIFEGMALTATTTIQEWVITQERKVAVDMAIEALKQPEIIRCKDCIHSSGVKMVDGWTYCAEGRLLVKYENGYCSDARRREE